MESTKTRTVWIEADSQEFIIWKTENPYGQKTVLPVELIEQHDRLQKELGNVRQQIFALCDF